MKHGQLNTKIKRFWYSNKHVKDGRQRSILVDALLAELFAAGYTVEQLRQTKIIHPKLARKERLKRYSVLDVLADFILDVDQVAERREDYPVLNAETERRRERERAAIEVPLITYDDAEDDDTLKPNEPVLANSVEDVLFKTKDVTVDELKALIREVKENPDRYVWRFSKRTGREPREVMRLIKRLDESRVKECVVCGGSFYAHDRRRQVCDLIPHPVNPRYSFCEFVSMNL
jgi:hypothetical protein